MFVVLCMTAMLCTPAFGAQTQENPMRKIISMLQDMQKELEREGEVEKEIFDKAICACEGGTDHLNKVIGDASSAVEELTAKVAAGNAEKAQLSQDVADHKNNAASAQSDLDQATQLRDKEHRQFSASEKDTKANLDGLSKAIPAIENGMGGAALMQMPGQEMKMEKLRRFVEVTKLLGNDERSNVLAFLDQGSDDQESSSAQTQGAGEILGILKNMKDEMGKDLSELQANDKRDHESFNELKAAKTNEIGLNNKAIITKEKRLGGVALELSENGHALEDSQEEKANGETFLAQMKEQCATVEQDKATRMRMRHDEISAISQAVSILNDDDSLEVFSKAKSAALVQQKKPKTYDALLQLASQKGVKVTATHLHRMLLLSVKQTKSVTKKEEPADPATAEGGAEKLVGHMIDGMVAVLHDEDVGDEHKKDWCHNETMTAQNVEAEKKETIEKTNTEIAEQEDELATTVAEIKALTEKIQELDKMVHEATENRKAQHQEFVDSFATSATALRLVDKAMKRLERFYSPQKTSKAKKDVQEAALKKAGLSLLHSKADEPKADPALVAKLAQKMLPADFDALVQVHEHTVTEARFAAQIRNGVDPVVIPDTPKKYEKKESGGIIGLMTEFKTDLKTDMTEAETEEKFMAKEYVRVMTDAKATRDQDVKSKNQKNAAKAMLDQKLVDNRAKLQLTEEELHNLQLYIVQLHTECDFLMRNFEVRHEGRVDEETGLEEAETIVTGEEPSSHKEVEKRYKEEHTDDDVDEHFPGTPIDDGPDKPQ